jgi:hypothetical protein
VQRKEAARLLFARPAMPFGRVGQVGRLELHKTLEIKTKEL